MSATLHLIKLCVGADTVEDLETWQARRIADRRAAGQDPRPRHVTRMWPKRADEIAGIGSLFWVFRGAILARQPIEAFEEQRGEDGIRRCAIIFAPRVIRVEARPRRPFQGWRYLTAEDAPPDLSDRGGTADLPQDLALALDGLGVVPPRR